MILHAEYHRPAEKALPKRYSRHYYDVALLGRGSIKAEALADGELLGQVVRHRATFYPSSWARYDLAIRGTVRIAPAEHRLRELRQDYREMAVMIFGEAPAFENLLNDLAEIDDEINGR